MAISKIQIKVGIMEFSGEGEQDWLAIQLEKILIKVPDLLKFEVASPGYSKESSRDEPGDSKSLNPSKITNLATWLKDKNATTNQTKKFLATAAFLQVGGKSRVSTSDVTNALKKSNQSRLGNPSDCLNSNVKKGFCEKDGNDFFVTAEGLDEIGVK